MMFHLYGLFIGIAVVVGYSVAEKIEPRVGKVAPWVLGFGFVGARLWHVIDFWSYYSQNLGQIVAAWNGGMGIWGGIVGGTLGLLFASSRAKSRDPSTAVGMTKEWVEMTSILGAIVTALPLAQAIGRLGNAVNGEFYDKVWILPWWGAEIILDLVLFCVLVFVSSRAKSRDPSTTASMTSVYTYLIGYLLIRLILNPFRADLR